MPQLKFSSGDKAMLMDIALCKKWGVPFKQVVDVVGYSVDKRYEIAYGDHTTHVHAPKLARIK